MVSAFETQLHGRMKGNITWKHEELDKVRGAQATGHTNDF